jgi:hypothetical protein
MSKILASSGGPYLPPDNPNSKYAGRSRVYSNRDVFKPQKFLEAAPPELNAWYDQALINDRPIPTPEQQAAEKVGYKITETFKQTGSKKMGPEKFPSISPTKSKPSKATTTSASDWAEDEDSADEKDRRYRDARARVAKYEANGLGVL